MEPEYYMHRIMSGLLPELDLEIDYRSIEEQLERLEEAVKDLERPKPYVWDMTRTQPGQCMIIEPEFKMFRLPPGEKGKIKILGDPAAQSIAAGLAIFNTVGTRTGRFRMGE